MVNIRDRELHWRGGVKDVEFIIIMPIGMTRKSVKNYKQIHVIYLPTDRLLKIIKKIIEQVISTSGQPHTLIFNSYATDHV